MDIYKRSAYTCVRRAGAALVRGGRVQHVCEAGGCSTVCEAGGCSTYMLRDRNLPRESTLYVLQL